MLVDAKYNAFMYYKICIEHLSMLSSLYNNQEEPK